MHYTAYLYEWKHLPTNMKYWGSRTSKSAHPDDGYICSSYIKEQIITNPSEWSRRILGVGTPAEIRKRENEMLMAVDAATNEDFFNLSNGAGKFSRTGLPSPIKGRIGVYTSPRKGQPYPLRGELNRLTKKGVAPWNKGLNTGPESLETREKKSLAHKGKARPDHSIKMKLYWETKRNKDA